jgi:hypothetical protein
MVPHCRRRPVAFCHGGAKGQNTRYFPQRTRRAPPLKTIPGKSCLWARPTGEPVHLNAPWSGRRSNAIPTNRTKPPRIDGDQTKFAGLIRRLALRTDPVTLPLNNGLQQPQNIPARGNARPCEAGIAQQIRQRVNLL